MGVSAETSSDAAPTAEHARLAASPEDVAAWRRWGPYVASRQWGTVREDYSADGNAWDYFPFDQSHARAYRWGEDGLGGLCDITGTLNFALAVWNGNDDRLKERPFGLTNGQGNHGEDVKEYWWPVDATPTHSWADWLYRYPQAAYPYGELIDENARRTRDQREYELSDTGILAGDRFFDVRLTYAKAAPDDVLITVSATNHGPDAAPLHLLPHLWFRNTWAWDQASPDAGGPGADGPPAAGPPAARPPAAGANKPELRSAPASGEVRTVRAHHDELGTYVLSADGAPTVLLCDNETNDVALFGTAANRSPYPKDGINRAVVHDDDSLINPRGIGTKAAFHYVFDRVAPGETVSVRLRLRAENTANGDAGGPFGDDFERIRDERRRDADEFYGHVIPPQTPANDALVARRAFAGLLWGKQLYTYSVDQWLGGDPGQPAPPSSRAASKPPGRNVRWRNLDLADVISMPDAWEYPWFAAWDLAFHCVTLAEIDPEFAKDQLLLLCREWAMHPSGQLPAYEWAFGDVNPPVHAWAAWKVYCLDGKRDTGFLVRIIGKLLLNFSWWVGREDADGSNLFEGGFLGMDNIGLFNRSAPPPGGARLEQSDATSWMAFYCLGMMQIAVELARHDPAWQDIAVKFQRHFFDIAAAMNSFGSQGVSLWDEGDRFFYDVLVHPDGSYRRLRVRSMVGLLPLMAVATFDKAVFTGLPALTDRLDYLRERRPEATRALVAEGAGTVTFSLLDAAKRASVLRWMLDEAEFLSPHGIRALSAAYADPYWADVGGQSLSIRYNPGESDTALFGGNSNWRGPVWFPVNALLADALHTYGAAEADEAGADAGEAAAASEADGAAAAGDGYAGTARDLDDRLIGLFRPGADGRRPSTPRDHGTGELWTGHPTFSEYFHGDTGEGLGASHQTGWTAFVAHMICQQNRTVDD